MNVEFRVRDNLLEVRFASPRDAATVYTDILRHRMTTARKANRILIYVPRPAQEPICERCGEPAPHLLFHLCAKCVAIVDRIYEAHGRNRVEAPP